MHRTRLPQLCAMAVVAGAATVLPARLATASMAAHSASTVRDAVITAFSDRNFFGNGVPQEFDQTNASFTGSVSTTGINLSVSGGTAGLNWSFVILPPPRTRFRVGYYPKAQWALGPSRSPGYVALDITEDGAGCSAELTGGIEIRDLAISGSVIKRLDLLYEQRCVSLGPALFGEIRIGEPRPAGLIVSSSSITWPARPGIAQRGIDTPVAVYLRNPGTARVSIGRASLTGLAAGEFAVADNTCSGTALGPGDSCSLFLRFIPATRGVRPAALLLPIASRPYRIQLDAVVRPGITSLTMESHPGDSIGQGQSYDLTPGNTDFTFNPTVTGLTAQLRTLTTGVPWEVDMFPAPGKHLVVGTYRDVVMYPYNERQGKPGLSVTGDGNGCDSVTGSFTVKQVVFSRSDGSLQNFDATFIQWCDNDTGALTGELKYDGEPVTMAAGVSRLKARVTRSGLAITWANPASARYRYTLVRIEPSPAPAGTAPYAGVSVYGGTGTRTTVRGLVHGHAYTVVAYAVDRYGNISRPARYVVTRY